MISQTKKAVTMNKCASIMGHFDGHDMCWCGYERIARCSMSRATLEAAGRHHRANIFPELPWRTPWSSILA